MGKVFTVAARRAVSDPDALDACAALAGPAIAAGNRVIARGEPLETREADLNQRVLLVEWDSPEQATAVHGTNAYQEALQRLDASAERDIRVVAAPG